MSAGLSFAADPSGKRQGWLKLLLALGGIVIGLLLVEAGLRLIGFSYPNFYQEDEHVGFALRPNAEGWWRKEAETYITINSDGLRDREHAKVKPPDTLRVAILGDSFAEALQVPVEDAFWAVSERRLQGCQAFGGRKVEIINFGVSGFSTARELITLRRRVWQYSPDIIVLLVTTANDVRDNSRLLSQEYAGFPLPYFAYQNGSLALDDSLLKARNESLKFRLRRTFVGRPVNWLKNHLRLFDLVDKARVAFQNNRQKQKNRPRRAGDEPGLDAKVYLEPTDPAWQEAWRVTEGLLTLMRDDIQAHGARFLVVTGSSSIQVYPDLTARQNFARALGAGDLFYPDRRITALGARAGIEVLNLAPTLQEYADQKKVFLHGTDGFGHWNAVGHRLVGEIVGDRLCQTGATN
jgi:hypothetical protein